jgi:hypothetical protein
MGTGGLLRLLVSWILNENLLHKWVRNERQRMAAAAGGGRSDHVGEEQISSD